MDTISIFFFSLVVTLASGEVKHYAPAQPSMELCQSFQADIADWITKSGGKVEVLTDCEEFTVEVVTPPVLAPKRNS